MQTEEEKINIKDKILSDIQSGVVSMRPRFQFTLKLVLLSIITLLVLFISVFILMFISFSIRVSHHEVLLGFGSQGILTFLYFFPWLLLALDVGLIFLLEWLLRKFRFGYRFPILYLLFVLFLVIIVSGLGLDRGTPFNDAMLKGREHLPRPVGNFYGRANHPLPKGQGVCFCKIITIEDDRLTVADNRDGGTTLTVILPENSPAEIIEDLEVGDNIFVAGKEHDGVIEAFGIRNIPTGVERFEFSP